MKLVAIFYPSNFFVLLIFSIEINLFSRCEGDVAVHSYSCPFFRVTGDNKAKLDTSVICNIWVCPGQSVEASLCEESVGDTYLRLYKDGSELGSSDDDCGELYGPGLIFYHLAYNKSSSCETFELYQGCYDVNMCYGTTHVTIFGENFGHPTTVPSSEPSSQPTSRPTHPSSAPSRPPSCQPSDEPSAQPTGQPTGTPSAKPSSPSGQPSQMPSRRPSAQPTSKPSGLPSSPSEEPSGQPSTQPSSRPTGYGVNFWCPFYEVVGDDRATNTNRTCSIWGCPGQSVEVDLCRHSFGDTFIRLFDGKKNLISNDDNCGERYGGSKFLYLIDESIRPCHAFTLVQGCYDGKPCSGSAFVTVKGSGFPTSIPSGEPSAQPTSHPSSPSKYPTSQPSGEPSGEPSSPSSQPTCNPSPQPSGLPTNQPSSQPSHSPSIDHHTSSPTIKPTPRPKPSRETTLIIAIGTPSSAFIFVFLVMVVYKYFKNRYSMYLEITCRVKCVSSLKFHDDFQEIDLFEDGDYEDLCRGL